MRSSEKVKKNIFLTKYKTKLHHIIISIYMLYFTYGVSHDSVPKSLSASNAINNCVVRL